MRNDCQLAAVPGIGSVRQIRPRSALVAVSRSLALLTVVGEHTYRVAGRRHGPDAGGPAEGRLPGQRAQQAGGRVEHGEPSEARLTQAEVEHAAGRVTAGRPGES
jgi:hypothetical protein